MGKDAAGHGWLGFPTCRGGGTTEKSEMRGPTELYCRRCNWSEKQKWSDGKL
jgi:hypothetical protein